MWRIIVSAKLECLYFKNRFVANRLQFILCRDRSAAFLVIPLFLQMSVARHGTTAECRHCISSSSSGLLLWIRCIQHQPQSIAFNYYLLGRSLLYWWGRDVTWKGAVLDFLRALTNYNIRSPLPLLINLIDNERLRCSLAGVKNIHTN